MKTSLLIFALLVAIATPAVAQDEPDAAPAEQPTPTLAQGPEVKPVPAGAPGALPKGAKPVKQESKEKIQVLIVEQGNKLIALQNNELVYLHAKEKLEADKADVDARLQAAAMDAARDQKLDTSKFTLDVQRWLWIPKP